MNTIEKIHHAIFSSDSLEEMEILINKIVADEQAEGVMICKKGHTIPLSNTKCRDIQCRNFTTDADGDCKNSAVVVGTEPKHCIVPYEKVAEEQNGRIMLGATEIGTVAGGKVLQSSNRNVITICLKGFYYHVNITDIVSAILGKEGRNA